MKRLSALLEHSKLYFGLLMMFGMAYAFTNYLDGDIGVVVWSFLLLAPLISVLLSYRACRHITAKLDSPVYLAKGRHFTAKVILTAEGRLPVPFLRFRLGTALNFVPDDPRIVQSAMTAEQPLEIPSGLTAQYAGCGEISVQELAVSDYLGWFRFPVKSLPNPVRVGVIPEIPSLSNATVMLHTVSNIVLTMDDEEEETSSAFSAQSMPGYVHRDYIPGDSLKRINWKMSAKRQKLMVRTDEATATVRPAVILDLQPETTETALKRREIILEGALGFLILLVRQGIPCTIRFASETVWKTLLLENEDDVRNAAVEIATADFLHDGNRIDTEMTHEKSAACLIYTSRPDEELAVQASALKDSGYVGAVFPAGTDAAALSGLDALWSLGEDFTMQNLKK
ncbi:MAG: DUF58 domain-containing protein [Oscillospiraceae bacterium]|nr:DUF58 domain-containing protein [Oscillospiraceae bacterium]